MTEYTVAGRFQVRDGWRDFTKRVAAANEDVAVEHVYALFGSEHGLKRTQLEIEGIEP